MGRIAKNIIIFKGKYTNSDACEKVINYALQHSDTSPVGGSAIFPIESDTAIHQFQLVKEKYNKTSGRQVLHVCLSYPDHLKKSRQTVIKDAERMSYRIGSEFQNVYGIHENTNHIHAHFVINSVSYKTGKKITSEHLHELLKYM